MVATETQSLDVFVPSSCGHAQCSERRHRHRRSVTHAHIDLKKGEKLGESGVALCIMIMGYRPRIIFSPRDTIFFQLLRLLLQRSEDVKRLKGIIRLDIAAISYQIQIGSKFGCDMETCDTDTRPT